MGGIEKIVCLTSRQPSVPPFEPEDFRGAFTTGSNYFNRVHLNSMEPTTADGIQLGNERHSSLLGILFLPCTPNRLPIAFDSAGWQRSSLGASCIRTLLLDAI